ncbi:MAG: aspartate aminotransferase family protein [Acidobacteria bacterium]|nr:MAG: aspartate aminotransferase family protein [Acidobacteriota bacterium]
MDRIIPNVPGQAVFQDRTDSALLRRSFRKSLPSAVRGDGAYLWDANGKQYLDFSGSAAVNFIGHGVNEIVTAMTDQARGLEFIHGSQFTTPIAEQYASELLQFAGDNFREGAVYFCSGGSEAVEAALKLARQYQVEIGERQRTQIVSRDQSYHGATLGAVAVSRNKRRREIYRPMLREFATVSTPYCYRCAYDCTDGCFNCGQEYAAEVEQVIADSEDTVAAVILEPVSGATLGAVVPPKGYLEKVAEICRRKEVLLIADEVMSGMGRTGRNFAVDHWRVTPDILVAAKGLSSGYAPLGALIISKKVVDVIASGSGSFIHGFTYSSHPISLAAGRAVLNHIAQHSLVETADSETDGSIAYTLRENLGRLLDLNAIGDVRGIGLLWAVEFVANRASKAPFPTETNFCGRVAQAAIARGLLVYPVQGCVDGDLGDHILIAPPAVISKEQISWAVEQLVAAVEEASVRP